MGVEVGTGVGVGVREGAGVRVGEGVGVGEDIGVGKGVDEGEGIGLMRVNYSNHWMVSAGTRLKPLELKALLILPTKPISR